MSQLKSVVKRELGGYFATPLAYVFIVIFLALAGFFTWNLGGLYESEQADLRGFFNWHPWLYLFLIPSVSMRLWAEERKTGTIELLLTLPVTIPVLIAGKFLAAWFFAGISLALTFPTWITVNYLGDPDNGAIAAGYVGSFLMAGGFLAIGSCISAITKNQVIAFVISIVLCLTLILAGIMPEAILYAVLVVTAIGLLLATVFLLLTTRSEGSAMQTVGALAGLLALDLALIVYSAIQGAPRILVETIGSFGAERHFSAISKGVVDVRDLVYFGTLMGLFLFANSLILDLKKAD